VGSVFISYRRKDAEGQARALFQDLAPRLGRAAVFMDVTGIALGRDFREVPTRPTSSTSKSRPH